MSKTQRDFKYKFEQELEDNQLTVEELDDDLKNTIKAFLMSASKYGYNPTEVDKTNKNQVSLLQRDIDICELIMDFTEKDLPEPSPDDELEILGGKPKDNEEEEEEEDTTKVKGSGSNDKNDESDKNEKQLYRFGTKDMQDKIKEICKASNGYIEEKQLIGIIGKKPDYPTQEVFSIRLKKIFMKSYYKIQ